MKNGGGTLAVGFSAIKFLHLLEGRGDFEGRSFRIRALIEAAKRKRGVNHRLPINPEMLIKEKARLNLKESNGSELRAAMMLGSTFP